MARTEKDKPNESRRCNQSVSVLMILYTLMIVQFESCQELLILENQRFLELLLSMGLLQLGPWIILLLGGKAFSFRSIILTSCLIQAARSIALKLLAHHESQVLENFAFSLSYYYVCLIVTSCIFVFLSSGLEAWKVLIACAWPVLLALFLSVKSLSVFGMISAEQGADVSSALSLLTFLFLYWYFPSTIRFDNEVIHSKMWPDCVVVAGSPVASTVWLQFVRAIKSETTPWFLSLTLISMLVLIALAAMAVAVSRRIDAIRAELNKEDED